MPSIQGYCDLLVWQQSMSLAEEVYKVTGDFPKTEIYGLTSQLRRAAVSVPSNIAEGQSRSSREVVHFLSIAHGSLSELETQMIIAGRLGYVQESDLAKISQMAGETGRLIHGLSRSIEKLATGHRPLAT